MFRAYSGVIFLPTYRYPEAPYCGIHRLPFEYVVADVGNDFHSQAVANYTGVDPK